MLGLPHNLAPEIPRHVYIVHPQKINSGSVEILQFAGASGRDFSARAVPPNIGALSLRFPVRDMGSLLARLHRSGIALAAGPVTLPMPPYGVVRTLAIRSPDGALLEFFQVVEP
ncbi:MAG: VOC family protein [Gammaproteobacteria bacterium]